MTRAAGANPDNCLAGDDLGHVSSREKCGEGCRPSSEVGVVPGTSR